jgi:hypothetical protein
MQFAITMPHVQSTTHRIQCAFAPLILRASFWPECLSDAHSLPWLSVFPLHDDSIPEEGQKELPAQQAGESLLPATVKKPRPKGEPGRTGVCGFNVKASLELPDGVYENLQVGTHISTPMLFLTMLIGQYPHSCYGKIKFVEVHIRTIEAGARNNLQRGNLRPCTTLPLLICIAQREVSDSGELRRQLARHCDPSSLLEKFVL